MTVQRRKKAGSWIVMIAMLMVGICGIVPEQARAERMTGPLLQGEDCEPNGGWMWTSGPADPEVTFQAQEELRWKGIDVVVEARNYGETDNCGTYEPRGIDFTVSLTEAESNNYFTQEMLVDTILPVLTELGKPELGNVELFSAKGERIPVNSYDELPARRSSNIAPLTGIVTPKVYVIVYDPLLSNGQRLSQYMHWNDHSTLTQQTIDFFNQGSHGEVNYTVVDTTVVTSEWPELMDGFKYTEQTYLAVWSNPSLHHSPTEVNYNKIINSPEFDICGKLNRGEIDEVWIYNGPWFGFYESTLAGPNAYPMNSPPVSGANNCNRVFPMMGPSLERRVEYFIEDFSHRAEATMTKVYGSWRQNDTTHPWNKFTLIKTQSPNYSYSGCGVAHYPPNAAADSYIYNSPSSVLSNCADFVNYPNLGDPLQVSESITCSAWGCTTLGYFLYWFEHFPHSAGCGPDNVANNWWEYMVNPELALHPYSVCHSDEHLISGNAGTVAVTLNYTDGIAKTAFTDTYGNYSLLVSNHWSGTITPAKPGYMFSPASLSYTDVQSDLYSQNYGVQTITAPSLYVNLATGNNNNSCTSIGAPCRNIQEAVNKSGVGSIIYVASDTYSFSTNPSPNVVIVRRSVTLSGGWNSDFTSQTGVSVIDGENMNNGILTTSGIVTMENFTIQNTSAYNGGSVYIADGSFTLSRSTLKNNTATSNGGGIFLDRGLLKVINSTIDENVASGAGGGIYAALNSAASVYIQNSTIIHNRASRGGGISRTNGTYNIKNTIIANNSSSISGPDCVGTIAEANSNIIENLAGCSITSGSNNLSIDPQALSGVDAGDDASCPTVDQRGVTRPQGTGCDIGAYEYVNTTIPVVNTFTSAGRSRTLSILITAFIASDDVAVSGYMITTNATSPAADAEGWSVAPPISYTVTNDGSYTLYPWVKDASGNVSFVFTAPVNVVVDTTAPIVAIHRAGAEHTSAASVDFTVTFSESVTSVDKTAPFTDDFILFTTGVTNASITNVSGSQAVYTVTVNTGTGNGAIRLDISSNTAITDLAANPLQDLPFDKGQVYIIEKTPMPPGKAALVSPGGSMDKKTPAYTWNSVSGATWYYLYVDGPSGNVLKQWFDAAVICSSGTCSVTPSTALNPGAYRWWVQTYNNAGYGPWSGAMDFTLLLPPPPGQATLSSPSGSIGMNKPTYSWGAVEGATWYYLYVDGPSGNVLKQWYSSAEANCNETSCSVIPTTILGAGAHRWWVQTYNSAGYGPWSDGLNFTVTPPALPGKTTLSAPNGSVSTGTPTYTWSEVTGATYYYLMVNNSSGTSVIKTWYTPTQASCSGGTCSVTPSTALGAGGYRWWVQTYNSAGYGPWSDGLDFTVTPPPLPGKTTLATPNGSTTDTTPDFSWSEVSGATWYYLWVSNSAGTPMYKIWYTPTQANCSGGTCSVTPSTVLGAGGYRWWVQTYNNAGYGPWSDGLNFSIP